jgi:5,10-methenyltetrahydrofolate synthetase
MHKLNERGRRVALPVVQARDQPLVFRQWTPDARLQPGIWNIPVPIDGALLDPDVVIAPLVGFDGQGYRLGYGGGFFDRTLADMKQRALDPFFIGVAHSSAQIPTIYPRPHDIPMHCVVTEKDRFDHVQTMAADPE